MKAGRPGNSCSSHCRPAITRNRWLAEATISVGTADAALCTALRCSYRRGRRAQQVLIPLAVAAGRRYIGDRCHRSGPLMSAKNTPFAWGNVSEDFALFRTLSSEQRLGRSRDGPSRIWCAGNCWSRRANPPTPCSWCCTVRSPCAGQANAAVRRTSRRRAGRRDRLLRQHSAHRQCDRHPRHQRAGADARRLSRAWPKTPRRSSRRCWRRLALRFAGETARLTADPRFADGANGGADRRRI